MSKILAIDTSTEACSVALLDDTKRYHDFVISNRDHTKLILPMIDELLAKANLTLSALDAIAFTNGPGSFTGVRIGISIAQGLAFGANKPLIAISTLKTLALGAYYKTKQQAVVPAIDARMNEVYIAAYHFDDSLKNQLIIKEQVINPEHILDTLKTLPNLKNAAFCGTGFETYPQLINHFTNSNHTLPNAIDMLEMAEIELNNGNIISADKVTATYLRNEVTWKKLPNKQ